MPHRLEKLRSCLTELENELDSIDSMDTETRRVLEEAAREIQEALDKEDPHHLEPHTLSEILQDASQQFSASHPTLSGIVSKMIDALAQLGI